MKFFYSLHPSCTIFINRNISSRRVNKSVFRVSYVMILTKVIRVLFYNEVFFFWIISHIIYKTSLIVHPIFIRMLFRFTNNHRQISYFTPELSPNYTRNSLTYLRKSKTFSMNSRRLRKAPRQV